MGSIQLINNENNIATCGILVQYLVLCGVLTWKIIDFLYFPV